jgi:hypothetical protein
MRHPVRAVAGARPREKPRTANPVRPVEHVELILFFLRVAVAALTGLARALEV